MKEHNTNFYSLENIKETLKSCEDFLDGEEVYYHIGALRFAYEEIERLNNIIDELEKWLEKHSKIDYECNATIIHEQMAISMALSKLKELKGSDKNEENKQEN